MVPRRGRREGEPPRRFLRWTLGLGPSSMHVVFTYMRMIQQYSLHELAIRHEADVSYGGVCCSVIYDFCFLISRCGCKTTTKRINVVNTRSTRPSDVGNNEQLRR